MKLLLLLLFILPPVAFANKGKVVATVNGTNIYDGELEEYYQKYLFTPQRKKVSKRDALNDLINYL
mgnify:CR=1 FL=1